MLWCRCCPLHCEGIDTLAVWVSLHTGHTCISGVSECCLSQSLLVTQVSDIAIAVREGADAVMLSGETAYGKFPFKAVDVMSTVAQRTESAMLRFSVSLLLLTSCI